MKTALCAARRIRHRDVIAALDVPGRIVVTAHARPDGDALGAALALGRSLAQRGRDAVVALARDEIGAPAILEGVDALVAPVAIEQAERLVCVDCGSIERLPEPLRVLVGRVPVVNIDHHPTNTCFGTVNWIDASCSSCGEMVWRLLRQAGWPLDRAIAEALWVAVVTDTGRFAHDSTRPATLRCGAELLRHGVRTAWINDCLYGQFAERVLRLKARAYAGLETWAGGRAAVVSLTQADFDATGCTRADAEDIIEIPRSLRGSTVALFFYEAGGDAHATRLSIRTREPLDATVLAALYGGGGHRRAAGCTVPLPMAEARRQVRERVEALLATPL